VKKRATITVHGMVQDAGFRGKIMRTAYAIGLVGNVENHPNGTVRVVCEGEEAGIKKLIKALDIHKGDVDVKKIDVKWTKASNKFQGFYVKYTDLGMEMFQGFSTAGKKFDSMSDKLDNITNATIRTHEKLDNITNATITTHEKLESIDNRLGDALIRYDSFGKDIGAIRQDITDMKMLASEFREFKDLFAIYVKHQMERDSQ
jgi:acylphosphatase